MNININNTNKAEVIFDSFGHLYLKYNGKQYEIIIDGKNNLSLEEISNYANKYDDCYNDDTSELLKQRQLQFGTFKLTTSANSLKGKALKEYTKNLNKLNEDEDFNDDEMNEDDFNTTKNYYPEDFEYSEFYKNLNNDDNDDTDNYNYTNNYILFLKGEHIKDTETPKIIYGDGNTALYETLIYNKDLSSGDLMYKTKIINFVPLYRLRLYHSGEIAFRPIGNMEKYYKLTENTNSELVIAQTTILNSQNDSINKTTTTSGLKVKLINLD